MEPLLFSFGAGVLTALAPCVLPVLPVILGGTFSGKRSVRPLIITLSLAIFIVLFTLLLKVSTLLIAIPQSTWEHVSGGILFFFGMITIFPEIWEKISLSLKFGNVSQAVLDSAGKKEGIWGLFFLGAALGLVFSSCSPVYLLILAKVLPESFFTGIIDLFFYSCGLSFVLFLIAFFGQKFLQKIQWTRNPRGIFRRGLGVLILIVGIAIFTGIDKIVEAKLVRIGYDGGLEIEKKIAEHFEEKLVK